jgi:hypothetical protein
MSGSHSPDGSPTTSAPVRPSRGPVTAVLDLFSSVRFGITLLSALFVYMSVGTSSIPRRGGTSSCGSGVRSR